MTHIMVITMGAIFIAFLVRRHVLPERFFTLLAHERHFRCLRQLVVLRLSVAFGAVEPQFAAGCTDRHLCIQDVLAVKGRFFFFFRSADLKIITVEGREMMIDGSSS